MTISLLATKLNIPKPRSDLVLRPHLVERIHEGVSKKLILISAPAGFGKTTILSIWGREAGLPIAWLSLDAEDNDPTRFLNYFIAALQSISPDIGQTSLAMLQLSQPSPMEDVLTALINELSSIPHDFAILLDDYHLIDAQQIHSALTYLIEHLPERMHVVITSRSDPPLPLSRLRARGQLLELRQADLRFTIEEAADFLNRSTGLELSEAQVAALEARTEGWIAGLQLAALSMRRRQDLAAFIQAFSGSHRFVIDYLADEVFAQQSQDLRQFLLDTSILDRFTASLCSAVTGRDDSASLLRTIEETNLFLLPLDDQREWYRYHHLFRDFLRTKIGEQDQADLHKKASAWFMANGFPSEAVKHALASGEIEVAVSVISGAVAGVFNQGGFQTLLGWLDALPEEVVRGNAVLATYKGLTLFLTSSYDDALPYAEAAEGSLSPGETVPIQGQFLSLKAHLALCEEKVDRCIHFSREALGYLEEGEHFIRNLTLNSLGQVLEMRGDLAAAADVYRQAYESGWQAGDRLGALVVFTNLVFALNDLGRRREAVAWCQQVVSEDESQSRPEGPILDAVYLSWSLLAYEANELDTARQYSQRALDLLKAVNFPHGILWCQNILTRVHLAQGEYDRMREVAREGRRLAIQMGKESIDGAWFAALEAQAGLDSGDLASAVRWAQRSGFTPDDRPAYWVEHLYFIYIRILLAQGQWEGARRLLDTIESRAVAGGRVRKLITVHLLGALTSLAQGDRQSAIQRVESALALAAPEGYRRAFLDEGQEIARLLPDVRSLAPNFVDELLVAWRSPEASAREAPELVNPLTERELEVLRLAAKGLSNREIAEVLVITLGTVKKHLNNIFSKLYVESRTQAAARGRELGLLK